MHLRALGVMGRTVKSIADRQCRHGEAISMWLEDAVVEEGLEAGSVEGVGSHLHRFHHEIFWFASSLLVYGY